MNPTLKTFPDGSEFTAAHYAGACVVGYIVGVGGFFAVDYVKTKIRKRKTNKFVQDMNQILGESI